MSVLHWVFLLCPVLGEHSTVLYLCSAVTVQAKPRKAKFYFFLFYIYSIFLFLLTQLSLISYSCVLYISYSFCYQHIVIIKHHCAIS